MIRPIITIDPGAALQTQACAILYRPSSRVHSVDRAVKSLLDDLIDTMRVERGALRGVGMAAPQVGVPWRVIVAEVNGRLLQLVNPELIAQRSASTEPQWESCLSVPDVLAAVPSPTEVTVRALGRNGTPLRLSVSGLLARVVRHEIDHCEGRLFTSRMLGKPFSLSAVLARQAAGNPLTAEEAVAMAEEAVSSPA